MGSQEQQAEGLRDKQAGRGAGPIYIITPLLPGEARETQGWPLLIFVELGY